jgi:(p)ppGpp synthase/HD superfamily hydrolase
MTPTDPLVVKAMAFAVRAHGSQTRKDGRTPYAVHPMAVLRLLATRLGVTRPEVLATAVLHDVLEDTPTSPEELGEAFGPVVLRWVRSLTLPPAAHGDSVPYSVKTRYLLEELETQSWEAVLVKVCDRWDNLTDLSSAPWGPERREAFRQQTLQWIEGVARRRALRPEPPELTDPLDRGLEALGDQLRSASG